jgi:hypothetical protein
MLGNILKSAVIPLALILYMSTRPVMAIDGDVEYSAPYIMVDPETGQIVTVNPGPRLKAHEPMPDNNERAESGDAGPVTGNVASSTPSEQSDETVISLPVIIVISCLFMVITGFVIWKSNKDREGKV